MSAPDDKKPNLASEIAEAEARRIDAELAELEGRRSSRDTKDERAVKLARIAELKLEEKFTEELGARGQAFEIVDCSDHGEPHVVVKLGASITHKRFDAAVAKAKDGVPPDHEFVTFVCANLADPDKKPEFLQIIERRPAILIRCATALLALFGGRKAERQGKF